MSGRALYRAVSQAHEHPRLIAWASTTPGRIGVWLAALLLLWPTAALDAVVPVLGLVQMVPDLRTLVLGFTSPVVLFGMLSGLGVRSLTAIVLDFALVAALLYACFRAASAYRRLPALVQRNGQIAWHALVWIGLAATWWLPRLLGAAAGEANARAFRYLLPFLAWRCGYMLLAGRRGSAAKSRFVDHLYYCLPMWGGTQVPYGKGYDHLERQRAASAESLARTQLAGLKLVVLALLWVVARRLLSVGLRGRPGVGLLTYLQPYALEIPPLGVLIAEGSPSLSVAWLGLFVELVDATLVLAISGHLIIGYLRLFGFDVFRNTYKPLLAQSIVDFWNRYYYYFKELLAEFFFFPTYVSYLKAYPRLRIVAATMAAAALGNVYYHALRDVELLVGAGAAGAWRLLAPRMLYALLLGAGISISMLRERRRRGGDAVAANPMRVLRRIAGVWLFYGLIHIWSVEPLALTFAQRTSFFLSLFGLG